MFELEYNENNDSQKQYEALIELYKNEEEKNKSLVKNLNKLKKTQNQLESRLRHEEILTYKTNRKLDEIYSSNSWKLSKPVRRIGKMFKRGNQINKKQHNRDKYSESREVERKLWGGFSEYALNELRRIKVSTYLPINERTRASRALARWYFDKGDYEGSLKELNYVNSIKPLNKPQQDRTLTEIKVLKKLNRIEQARRHTWDTISTRGLSSELCLAMAHLSENENEKLNWYNIIFEKNGYEKIRIDNDQDLDIENIYADKDTSISNTNSYKITIIIPAYNASELIHIALNSLLNQSHTNLEIIVVDDCSEDNTIEVVKKYTENDNRIKLIKKDKNEGAYVARNTGLKYATGDFITVHDSDDWSHPQKLEVQLKELINYPELVGTISYLVRSTKKLLPLNGGSLLSNRFLMMNSSSLLVRRKVFEEVGGWDKVRVAGDSEFIWRLEKVYGKDKIKRIEPNVPLSIALSNENSLTGTSTTHVKTIMFGLRRTYRESFEWWHQKNEDLFIDINSTKRNFPCPVVNLPDKGHQKKYKVILIADFSDSTQEPLYLELLNDFIDKYEDIAIFHWPNYEKDPEAKINNNIYEIIHNNNVDLLVPNQQVESDNLFYLNPYIYKYVLDHTPSIHSNKAYVINDEIKNSQDLILIEENLYKVMNSKIKWISYKEILKN